MYVHLQTVCEQIPMDALLPCWLVVDRLCIKHRPLVFSHFLFYCISLGKLQQKKFIGAVRFAEKSWLKILFTDLL
jgi:hypothetical protein